MTTFLGTGVGLTWRGDDSGTESRMALEGFWAAVNFDRNDSECNEGAMHWIDSPTDQSFGDMTPEIFSNSHSAPMIDVSDLWTFKPPPTKAYLPERDSDSETRLFLPTYKMTQPAESNRGLDYSASSILAELKATIPEGALWTKSARHTPCPNTSSILDHLREGTPAPSTTTAHPTTALLAMTSSFLESIAKLAQSRSSTPCTTIAVGGEGDIQIVESEVFINIIEDGKRAGLYGPSELQEDFSLDRLDIPPPSTIPVPPGNYDIQSSISMVDGPAGCAQELDAMSWMSCERQLNNIQASFWH